MMEPAFWRSLIQPEWRSFQYALFLYLTTEEIAHEMLIQAMREQWIKNATAFIVVYSATRYHTFRECEKFVNEVQHNHTHKAAQTIHDLLLFLQQILEHRPPETSFLPVILAETKIDLTDQREVPLEAGPEAAQSMGVLFTRHA